MNEGEIRKTLRELGVKPARRLGQHFLKEDAIAIWMVEQAGISSHERILEIGPGLGILTKHLLTKTDKVTVVEKDRTLARYIEETYDLDVIIGDALQVELPEFDKAVSNLPYQISSGITMKVLETGFRSATMMYQKEFADHLVAAPGIKAYSRISVMTQYRARAKIIKKVPKGCFHPPPKVDSAVVQILPHTPEFHITSEDTFILIVRALFSHKNRTVRNGLISEHRQLGLEKDEIKGIAGSLPNSDKRPVKLSPAELAEIVNEYYDIRKSR